MATLQGKWRFREVLVIDADLSQNVNFTSTTIFEDGTTRSLTCSAIYVTQTTDDATGHVDYTIESVVPDDSGTYPKTTEVYMDSDLGWGSSLVGQSLQIMADFGSAPQEVSDEFYTWFTANAVEQTQVSGKWKFNSTIKSIPYETLELAANKTDRTAFLADHGANLVPFQLVDYGVTATLFRISPSTFWGDWFEDGVPTHFYDEYMVSFRIDALPPEGFEDASVGDTGTIGNPVSELIDQVLDFGEPQYVSVVFYNWLIENATTVSVSVTYNGSTLVSLFRGDTVTLNTTGTQLEDGIRIEVYDGGSTGSGDCSGKHIVEVTELPSENFDETAIYRLAKEQKSLEDILYVEEAGSSIGSFKAILPYGYYYAETRPEIGQILSVYYIEDEDKVYACGVDGEWEDLAESFGLPRIGIISDPAEASNERAGYYILVGTTKTGDFYTYSKPELKEIYINLFGALLPMGALAAENGVSITYYYVETTPPIEEILPTIEGGAQHYYYVADLNDIYLLGDGEWQRLAGDSFIEIVDEPPSMPAEQPMYAWVSKEWTRYIAPQGIVNVNERGRYDVTEFATVYSDIPDAAVCGRYELNYDIASCPSQVVNFTFVSDTGEILYGTEMGSTGLDGELIYSTTTGTEYAYNPCYSSSGNCWYGENYRYIDFGPDPQLVSSEYRTWVDNNGKRLETVISDETLIITPSNAQQMFSADVFYKSITVEPVPTETITVSAGATNETYTPTAGKYFSKVTVNKADLSDLSTVRILCGIYLKAFPKTEYTVGDWLSVKDGVVCCQYTDGSTEDIAMNYSMVLNYEAATAGTRILNVSYTEGGITSKTTYQITVKEQEE